MSTVELYIIIQFLLINTGVGPPPLLRITKASCILLIGIVLNLVHIGKYGRDEALIEEVKNQIEKADGTNMIEISPDEYTQWAKHAYYMRYGKISLSPTGRPSPIDSRRPTCQGRNDMGDTTEQLKCFAFDEVNN